MATETPKIIYRIGFDNNSNMYKVLYAEEVGKNSKEIEDTVKDETPCDYSAAIDALAAFANMDEDLEKPKCDK